MCIHVWGAESWRGALEFSPAQWRAQPWRLLSYGLVHAHARHLALNALVALAVSTYSSDLLLDLSASVSSLASSALEYIIRMFVVCRQVGWQLEREQGWWRVAAVWAGGVLGGALGAGALQPRSLRVVGASAAVYALLTAHLPNVCLR